MSGAASASRSLYQDLVLRHGRSPLHARRPDRVDASAVGDNPMCGDRVEVFVRHGADGCIAEIGFEARGCAISVASADLMADILRGATAAEVVRTDHAFRHMIETGEIGRLATTDLRALSGLHDYKARRRCATLPWDALQTALNGARGMAEGVA